MRPLIINNKRNFASMLVLAVFLGGTALAWADADSNQLLSFKRLYAEPPTDNVDGVLRGPVQLGFQEIFSRNPRFEILDKKETSDAIIRTRIDKKTSSIDLEITILLTPTDETFSTDHASIAAAATEKELHDAAKSLLKAALKHIPFYGSVTGRDGKEITLDVGAAHGLKRGDIVQISRVDNIKRHPLLKSIVDVQLVPVGSIEIEQVEDTIAFGKITNEITGETIQKTYKVTAIEARALEPKTDAKTNIDNSSWAPGKKTASSEQNEAGNRPTIGYLGFGLSLDSFSSSTTTVSDTGGGSQTYGGSAFNPGIELNGELWLTKNFFADFLLEFSTMSFSQVNNALAAATTGTTSPDTPGVSSSTRTFGLDVGYKYLPTGSIYGPFVSLKAGYYNFTWATANNAAISLSPKSYTGLNLGVGGGLPIAGMDNGLLLNVNLLLFPSLSEDGLQTGLSPSASAVNFFIGGYHYFTQHISMKAGFEFEIYTATFGTGATQASTSQKQIGLIPSLQYYF